MAANILETWGTVRSDGSLDLDEKIAITPGRVKVRLEVIEPPSISNETLIEFVERTRRDLKTSGHQFMNDEEVSAWVEELRADDDRIEEVYRQSVQNKQQGSRP